MAQVVAILKAIEERLDDPEGRVQQAQNDALRTYGLVAQIGEIMGIQRDQVMALSDVIAILVGRFSEHDRKVAIKHSEILALIGALAHSVDQSHIASDAAKAHAQLEAEAHEIAAQLAHDADTARELLSVARLDALGDVKAALNRAEHELTQAAEAARDTLKDE